ncbi:zinc finger protein 816-like [Folsomia candida]|uniref:zinc finger protein 816-like n=1 Tax=Folsomia candida TaxID=158441 RepID=UPI001604AF10|nr:zinc finger protein 816-like [Folsomia candida]
MDIKPVKKSGCPKFSKKSKEKADVATLAKLKCQICRKIFKNPNTLRLHMARIHTSRERPRCPTCHRVFFISGNLREHIKAVHGTKERPRFPCTFPGCDKTYLQKSEAVRHAKIEHAQNPVRFRCTLCEKEFKTKGKLGRHILSHTTEKPHNCATCGRSFAEVETLKSHETTHLDKSARDVFQCRICPQIFLTKSGLRRHIRDAHENQRNYPCAFCDKRYSCASYLKGHVERKHATNKELIHSCDKCEYKGHAKRNLAQHVRIHNVESWRECYFCQKKFARFADLVKHCSRIHCLEK